MLLNRGKVNGGTLSFYLILMIFRGLLDASYILIISPNFEYSGFYLNLNISQYILSWLVYMFSSYWVRQNLYQISDFFFMIAILLVVAPMTTLYGLDIAKSVFPLATTSVSMLFIYFIINSKVAFFKSKLSIIKGGDRVAIIISVLFVTLLIARYLSSGVVLNLDFSKVYDYRLANEHLSGGAFINYLNSWTLKVFNIFAISYFLLKKRFLLVVIFFLIQVYFYSASAHKSVLFMPFLIFGIWFYFKHNRSLRFIPIILSLVILTSMLTYYLFGDLMASSLFSRRVFFVPAYLTYIYFEFFSYNTYVFWSNSITSSFLDYQYTQSIPFVIGDYLGDNTLAANNGFISSGYAHAGLLGVAFYSTIVGYLLKFINRLSEGAMPIWFVLALCIAPLRTLLTSSDLLTTMLTHGFFLIIILIFLVRRPNNRRIRERI
jgi:hypothetical protein